jgi:dimethylargininase
MAPARVAVTRTPPASLVRCELTWLPRAPIDIARARHEHAAYCAELERLGCRVVTLPEEERYPDSCFVEDTAVVLDELAVLARPGAPSRLGEVDLIAPVLASYRPLSPLMAPATLDGGDVVRMGRVLYAGRSSRTSEDGIRGLARIVEPHGYRVVAVPFDGCLHLKSAGTALDEETVLLNPGWVDPAHYHGRRVLPVDPAEPAAGDVLAVGGEVLMNAACPRTIARVEAAGYTVRPVDIGEFAKAEGGLTCLSLVIE